jgi:hypothetical protein
MLIYRCCHKILNRFIMKFPIAFISLLTTAAYAQHEPKSLHGSVEDFDFLEDNVVTVAANSVATINCGSGDQCCVQGTCGDITNTGVSSIGGGGACMFPITSGTVKGAGSCILSCTGSCNVSVAAGGGGGGGPPNRGGGWGWPSNGGGRSDYGCMSMPPLACTNNPFCTIDQNGNCVASGQAPPYEEFDEEVDYDSSIDEEDEGAYDMAAEE